MVQVELSKADFISIYFVIFLNFSLLNFCFYNFYYEGGFNTKKVFKPLFQYEKVLLVLFFTSMETLLFVLVLVNPQGKLILLMMSLVGFMMVSKFLLK